MSTDATDRPDPAAGSDRPADPAASRPTLPTFDASPTSVHDVPTGASGRGTPIAPPTTPYAYPPASPAAAAVTGPAPRRRWSGRRTAAVAAGAVVLAAVGAVGAVAAVPAGSRVGGEDRFGPGGAPFGRHHQNGQGFGRGGGPQQGQGLGQNFGQNFGQAPGQGFGQDPGQAPRIDRP